MANIPVTEKGKTLAVVEWEGDLREGTWRIVRVGTDNVGSQRAKRAIESSIKDRGDLSVLEFDGPDGRTYSGWSGFTGFVGALGTSLPAYGMEVDRNNTTWPTWHDDGSPSGIDTEATMVQHQRWTEEEEVRNGLLLEELNEVV